MSRLALTGGCLVVFVSYSREDETWRGRFAEMLKPLVRERRLEVWSDDRMVVGYEWRPQLAEAIGRARVALLLLHQRRNPRMRRRVGKPVDRAGNQARRAAPGAPEQRAERAAATCSR